MKNQIVSLALALAFTGLSAQADSVSVLNQKLQQQEATWTAKKTPLTGLTPEEARRHMGLDLSREDVQFVLPPQQHIKSALPAMLDWRNKDGQNWVSPILDQGNCGSCVAFAAVGTLETQYRITSGLADNNVKLSPQNLFSCGGGACSFGWWPSGAASYLMSKGIPDEACQPYMSGATGDDVACSEACTQNPERVVKISSYTTPTRYAKDIEAVRQALQKGPLVTTLSVYEDFMSYGEGVYKHTLGSYLGGHAISIIGYDDTKQAFIIRNSWGKEWGEQGFGYVSYEDASGVGDETWSYDLPAMNGAVSLAEPLDATAVTKTLPLKAQATFTDAGSMALTVFDQNSKAVWNGSCSSSTCAQDVDVSALIDGRYEAQATAFDGHGNILGHSGRHYFYVANTEPQLTLSFKGKGGLNLDQPLSGRPEFDIEASSSTAVPMSSVEFHYRGPDGKDRLRSAQVVINHMTMGWRTNLVPDGTYEIWMLGRLKTNGFEKIVETPHLQVQLKN